MVSMNNNIWVLPNSNGNLTNSNISNVVDNGNHFDKLKYFVTIIGDGKLRNICLNDFNKDVITFGRGEDCDIVLVSNLVSKIHGYFSINNGIIRVFDYHSKNGIFINNSKCNTSIVLKNGDSIKIDNPSKPIKQGIIMIVTEN